MAQLESVPNVSEGRDIAVVAAIGVVRDTTGPVIATVAVVVIVAALAAAAAALAAAALRARSVTERAGRSGRIAITAITTVWILGTLAGAQVLPGVPLAAADSTAVLVSTTTGAAQSLRDEMGKLTFLTPVQRARLMVLRDELLHRVHEMREDRRGYRHHAHED